MRQGWAKPTSAKKYHYFNASGTTSLCVGWARPDDAQAWHNGDTKAALCPRCQCLLGEIVAKEVKA